jgi:hypothetical protein
MKDERVGHVACIGKKKSANRVLVGSLKETERLRYLNVNGRIILKLILKKAGGIMDQDSSGELM